MRFAVWPGLGRLLAGLLVWFLPLAWAPAAEPKDKVLPPPASAAAPKPSSQDEDLRARIERLEKQNQELLQALQQLQSQLPKPGPAQPSSTATIAEPNKSSLATDEVKAIVSDYLKDRDAKKKQEDEAKKLAEVEQGFVVGKNLGLSAKWKDGPWLESADQAFKLHIGARTQIDVVSVTAPDNVMFGKGGIGPYHDAWNVRRGRLSLKGTCWEVCDFYFQYDFFNTVDDEPLTPHPAAPNTVINAPVPTDMWVQISHIPLLGNCRVGNQKVPIGFEHLVSSANLDFLERSYQYDAFIENGANGFTPGLQLFDAVFDDRATWALGLFKNTRGIFGWNIGDGEWGVAGRLSWLPLYRDNGRYLVHLGLGSWFSDLDDDVSRWRARPLLRNGNAVLHNVVAISQVHADNEFKFSPELVVQYGPFLLQAEYMSGWIHGVDRIVTAGSVFSPVQKEVKVSKRDFLGQGFYVEGLWFLTGEHRSYNQKTGLFGRVMPFRNFYGVRGEGGHIFSPGAWQVGLRYSYLDLNDNGIHGGELHDVTVGLNWFLNPNVKIQWNYSLGFRSVPTGTSNGPFHAGGMRFALDF